MHLSKIEIVNFRCFGEGPDHFELSLRPGLTALVGENDAGKTAVIDALRFVLGTTDQEWFPRLEDTDFHKDSREIRIVCKFEKLSAADKRAFVEYLTYGEQDGEEPVLYVNWTATDTGDVYRGRPYRRVEVNTGKNGDGPTIATTARELLRATYLRPLRDAEQALSAGRGSRLSQVLQHTASLLDGDEYKPGGAIASNGLEKLSVLGIGDLANALIQKHRDIEKARNRIDEHLGNLSLTSEIIKSNIDVSGADDSDSIRLRRLLEKLNLSLNGDGKLGLGANNLLFMACELLLLAEDQVGNRMLLIEEPESHLDAQRQLRTMVFLQKQAHDQGMQVILTTHSPNLASAIDLDNIVMIRKGRAFSMAKGETELDPSDYRFLQRFLDVTKANLFFARGVMIVEGDAENILLPTLANLIGRDFTEHGVSIVNVGGVGLRRYARIFQRKNVEGKDKDKHIDIPVACVTDMDVMPDCAPVIIGKLGVDEDWPEKSTRRWKVKSDVGGGSALSEHLERKVAKASGQSVKTFVSDEWTLEYDLALGPKDEGGGFTGGLAEDVYIAACLAKAETDETINTGQKDLENVTESATKEFHGVKEKAVATEHCTAEEVLAAHVYAKFTKDRVSKAVTAQYLAERLQDRVQRKELTRADLRKKLPRYLVEAINYVTGVPKVVPDAQHAEEGVHE